jgi:hypothetical protein
MPASAESWRYVGKPSIYPVSKAPNHHFHHLSSSKERLDATSQLITPFFYATNHQHSPTAAMAPPCAPKKSISTARSTATIRQAAQQSSRQITDQAEDLDDSGEANSAGDDNDVAPEEAEASHNSSDGPLEHLMEKMVDDVCLDEPINYIPPPSYS